MYDLKERKQQHLKRIGKLLTACIKRLFAKKSGCIDKNKCKCGLCGKHASCKWKYAQPGDIDGDMLSWIYLCDEHVAKYSGLYPPPMYVGKYYN